MSDASSWFKRVSSLPAFVSAFGYVKMSAKALKPGSSLAQREKPKVVAKEEKKVAAKPKDNGGDDDGEEKTEKKKPNPLDLLPPTTFDLFNFKTFYVNCKDKKGEGIEELKK